MTAASAYGSRSPIPRRAPAFVRGIGSPSSSGHMLGDSLARRLALQRSAVAKPWKRRVGRLRAGFLLDDDLEAVNQRMFTLRGCSSIRMSYREARGRKRNRRWHLERSDPKIGDSREQAIAPRRRRHVQRIIGRDRRPAVRDGSDPSRESTGFSAHVGDKTIAHWTTFTRTRLKQKLDAILARSNWNERPHGKPHRSRPPPATPRRKGLDAGATRHESGFGQAEHLPS